MITKLIWFFYALIKTKADSQADLSLSWAHRSVCFGVLWLSLILFLFLSSQVKEINGKSFAATCEYCKDSVELSLCRIHGRFIQTATCEYCKGSIELSLWRIHGRFMKGNATGFWSSELSSLGLQTVDNQIYFNKCPGVIAIYKS